LKLIVTGSIAYDYLMSFPGRFADHFIEGKLDKISVSFLVDEMNKQQGGCAANIAYSLALLEEKPLLVGAVGKDFGPYRDMLESVGVDTSSTVEFKDLFTASFFANTDETCNQICSFYTGAMQHARDISLKSIRLQDQALAIISPNDPDAMRQYADECRELCIPFIYDPSQQIARLSGYDLRAGIKGSKVLIVNEYELEMFIKKTGIPESSLLNEAETVIVTLAEKGAEIRTQETTIAIPPGNPVQISDPTGVGDAFRSGLMKGMINGLSWETAGRMGTLAASYVIETEGPQSHKYDLKAFVERYKKAFGEADEVQTLI
jgi:adenosine kinase